MGQIKIAGTVPIGGTKPDETDKQVTNILDDENCRMISIGLWNEAVLSRHHAPEPITVLCLSGSGVFKAGSDLEESQTLDAGAVIKLDAGIDHELAATPEISILVTRFKNPQSTAV